jgi:hypothetical protein
MEWVSDRQPDSAEDWTLPEHACPPLLGELVTRIAAVSIGAAALDAAEQARRAAELAERASAAMGASRPAVAAGDPATGASPPYGATMADFTARADRVARRLRHLQHLPLSA